MNGGHDKNSNDDKAVDDDPSPKEFSEVDIQFTLFGLQVVLVNR